MATEWSLIKSPPTQGIDTVSSGDLIFRTGGFARWAVQSDGHFVPEADDTYDLGTSTQRVSLGFFGNGSAAAPSISVGESTSGLYLISAAVLGITLSGTARAALNASTLNVGSAMTFGWSSNSNPAAASADLVLARDAANQLALRRTTNPQSFYIYNTYTNSTNYERLNLHWLSNIATIEVAAAGTGTQRVLSFATNGSHRWQVTTAGMFIAATDASYDIGASGATRPRTGYFSNSLVVGGQATLPGIFTYGNTPAGAVETFRLSVTGNAATGRGPILTFYAPAGSGTSALRAQIAGQVDGSPGGKITFSTTTTSDVMTNRWKITAGGHFYAETDNVYDIGTAGATRPRTGYFGTSVVVDTILSAGTTANVFNTVATTINLGGAASTTIQTGNISGNMIWACATIAQNSQSTAYTTVAADANKHILHPTADNNARTFTIAANASVAYAIGTAITFVNQINTLTIAINSDTLTLAGTGATGSVTMAAHGVATAIKVSSTVWYISGTGIS